MRIRISLPSILLVKSICAAVIFSASSSLGGLVHAETIQIPVGQQGQNKGIQRPRTGQSQESVRTQFGNPIDWSNPVGDPPITKWTYGEFMVYFEYDHVIHTVLKHTPQPGAEATSGTVVESSNDNTGESEATAVLRAIE